MYQIKYLFIGCIPALLFLSILSYSPLITPKALAQFYADNSDENTNSTAQNSNSSDYHAANIALLSQKLKKGPFSYNHIVGQVKNLGNDTAQYIKIGLTSYDKNGDVVGTDSTYSSADSLKPGQKSSFDMSSLKDNFKGMKYYELSLQWQDSDGTDQYVENAQIYKTNGTKP